MDDKGPYCVEHARVAFQPGQKNKQRTRLSPKEKAERDYQRALNALIKPKR